MHNGFTRRDFEKSKMIKNNNKKVYVGMSGGVDPIRNLTMGALAISNGANSS